MGVNLGWQLSVFFEQIAASMALFVTVLGDVCLRPSEYLLEVRSAI